MTKWTGLLKQLVTSPEQADGTPVKIKTNPDPDSEGMQYIQRVRDKLAKLVEDFSQGRLNRAQFEELYAHYQKERAAVEKLITARPSSEAWRMAVTEGESIYIRRRLAARALGYAVLAHEDQVALRVYGEFNSLSKKWVPSLLARVRQDVTESYVVGSFDTGDKDAACLCAVPGEFSTLVVLFTKEPAPVQLQTLEDLHSHFEQANYPILARSLYQSNDLIFPYAAAFE